MNKTLIKWAIIIPFSVHVGIGIGLIWYEKILQAPIPPPIKIIPVIAQISDCSNLGDQINAYYELSQTPKWNAATDFRGMEILLPDKTCTVTNSLNIDFEKKDVILEGNSGTLDYDGTSSLFDVEGNASHPVDFDNLIMIDNPKSIGITFNEYVKESFFNKK